jgi:hypothetical protein
MARSITNPQISQMVENLSQHRAHDDTQSAPAKVIARR